MSPRRRPPTLLEAAQADVDEQWGRVQDQLLPWDTRLAHKAKRWTRVIAAVTGLVTVAAGAVGTVKGYAGKLWRVVARGRVAPAEMPATGQPTIATDQVPKPDPPKP